MKPVTRSYKIKWNFTQAHGLYMYSQHYSWTYHKRPPSMCTFSGRWSHKHNYCHCSIVPCCHWKFLYNLSGAVYIAKKETTQIIKWLLIGLVKNNGKLSKPKFCRLFNLSSEVSLFIHYKNLLRIKETLDLLSYQL